MSPGTKVIYTRQRNPGVYVRRDGTSTSAPLVTKHSGIFLYPVGEKSARISIDGKEVTVLLRQLTTNNEGENNG